MVSNTTPCSIPGDRYVVFIGTVIHIENPPTDDRNDQGGTSQYRFRIDEKLFGVEKPVVDVLSGRGGGDCSYHFKPDQQYLVFPHKSEDGTLYASICSQTQPSQTAGELLTQLRALRDSKPVATLFGVLRQTPQPYASVWDDEFYKPIPETAIQLRGENQTSTTTTDDAGQYKFYNVPPGEYQFWAALPPHLELAQTIPSDPLPPMRIEADTCYEEDLEALPTGRIRGRVIDPDGNALSSASVELHRVELYKEGSIGWWEYQGEEGYFEFDHLAPGKYILVYNRYNSRDPDSPYPKTYYPGVTDSESTIPIQLIAGEERLNADIYVRGGEATRVITVRLKWQDNPASFGFSSLDVDASRGQTPLQKELEHGVYQLTIFKDAEYEIMGTHDCGLRWEGNVGTPRGSINTEPVTVRGSDEETTEVTLIFTHKTCTPYSRD